ncbi:glycoside hydrolase family 3 domain protein [Gregarina niphandrodes]|uniref:beta-glucosidase n=1 Tax=Gregarina niphandrodes TaxID=110365 RepID=A0A023B2W5_GRENI|nr:glycoside hydrolase family 3 domain protein [Gregarina niphandrodes]EZG52597.1 glycoside hydrolase family 3 domain protein [Gregarina niphandrodes]|eukprot:XP_011131883.1 glycoside hydrolase family 3 domain protein [Gregarina niphandrodes]
MSSDSASREKKLNWLLGFLLLVATTLAIVFGVLWGKSDDDDKTTTVTVYQNAEVPQDGRTTGLHKYYDGVADELPNIKLNSDVQKIYDGMSYEQRLGQTIQYAIGDLTGPPIIDGSDDAWMTLIQQGMVGSMLNVLNLTFLNMAQKAAKEATGVPLLMGYDILHGFKTIFPVNLGMASSWDPAMVEEATAIAAGEAAAGGLYWAFAPMVDLTRDARWGRMSEGFGEDPLLSGRLGAAVVKGYKTTA